MQMDAGYVLTCCALPTADAVIQVDIEDQFYSANQNLVT